MLTAFYSFQSFISFNVTDKSQFFQPYIPLIKLHIPTNERLTHGMSFYIHGIVRLCSLPTHPFYWQVTGDRVLCGLNKPFRDLSAQCIVKGHGR